MVGPLTETVKLEGGTDLSGNIINSALDMLRLRYKWDSHVVKSSGWLVMKIQS